MSSPEELDRLLARGRLSAAERERIFEKVAKRVVRKRSPWPSYVLLGGPIALAAAVAFVLGPLGSSRDGYRAKGTHGSRVEVTCSGGELSACPRGSTLLFRVEEHDAAFFLQAYAEGEAPGVERVWYFPTASSPALRIEPSSAPMAVSKGIAIGTEHVAGRYKIRIVLTNTSLTRDEILVAKRGDQVLEEDVIDLVVTEP